MTDFIRPKQSELDAENSFVVGTPVLNTTGTNLISTKSADVHNTDTTLNTTASTEDRGAKWERPHDTNVSGPAGAFGNGHTR